MQEDKHFRSKWQVFILKPVSISKFTPKSDNLIALNGQIVRKSNWIGAVRIIGKRRKWLSKIYSTLVSYVRIGTEIVNGHYKGKSRAN